MQKYCVVTTQKFTFQYIQYSVILKTQNIQCLQISKRKLDTYKICLWLVTFYPVQKDGLQIMSNLVSDT